jgi:putative addiction module killer protein
MPAIREYIDAEGRSPFQRWFEALAAPAAAKVRTALARLEDGNMSALKGVGRGVHELRIDFGPGYRVYLGRDGSELVILLGGSTKSRQSNAISDAYGRWTEYRHRKRREKRE